MNLSNLKVTSLILVIFSCFAGNSSAQTQVPFEYGLGMSLYLDNCGSCHGQWADGSEQGPPLMHKLYVPSHHGDEAFYRAALQGARAHHWQFGDMPPVEGISRRALDKIIPYIRWLQRENKVY